MIEKHACSCSHKIMRRRQQIMITIVMYEWCRTTNAIVSIWIKFCLYYKPKRPISAYHNFIDVCAATQQSSKTVLILHTEKFHQKSPKISEFRLNWRI